ncbi:MAG: hypothetical protein R3E31_14555 [Chloroflexota bacterium]
MRKEIVTQADQWPGGLPSNTWAAGQVIVDDVLLDIPADLPAGDYQLAVGVYGRKWHSLDGDRCRGERPFPMTASFCLCPLRFVKGMVVRGEQPVAPNH